jgi:hypothetical protein
MIVDSLGVTGYFIAVKYRFFNNKTATARASGGNSGAARPTGYARGV